MSERSQRDDFIDLLVAQATEGLSAEDAARRNLLQAEYPKLTGESFELAAAAADVAFQQAVGVEAMPPALRERLAAVPDSAATARNPAGVTDIAEARARRDVADAGSAREAGIRRTPAWLGWAVAAALAVALVMPPLLDLGATGGVGPGQSAGEPDLAAQRADVLAAGDAIVAAWDRPEAAGYEQVRGDVVWDNASQRGFMRLTGMPANDPARSQYQLWIVDPERDAEPVDGGVFDIPPGAGEVLVPIDAKLTVITPAAFAITREKPGGVVVSEGPLLVVAPVGSG